MALIILDGLPATPVANSPSVTEVIGPNLSHWWTPIKTKTNGTNPILLPARKGSSNAASTRPEIGDIELFGRQYKTYAGISGGVTPHFQASIPKISGTFSIVSLQRATKNGSEPWGISFGASSGIYAAPRAQNTNLMRIRGINSGINGFEQYEAQPGLFISFPLYTVIDTNSWAIKMTRDPNSFVSGSLSVMAGAAIDETWLVSFGSSSNLTGFAGEIFELMIMPGDISLRPDMMNKINGYIRDQYEGVL